MNIYNFERVNYFHCNTYLLCKWICYIFLQHYHPWTYWNILLIIIEYHNSLELISQQRMQQLISTHEIHLCCNIPHFPKENWSAGIMNGLLMIHLQSQLRGHILVVLGALHKGSVQGFESKGNKVELLILLLHHIPILASFLLHVLKNPYTAGLEILVPKREVLQSMTQLNCNGWKLYLDSLGSFHIESPGKERGCGYSTKKSVC